MKVILNVDAITHPITGIGQYALALGQQLNKHAEIDAIKFFSADRWVDQLDTAEAQNRWLSQLRQWIPFKSLALNLYGHRRAKKFKQLTEGLEDHVFHSPNFVLMAFAGRSLATFHDLSFVHYRDTQPNYRLRYLDREIPKTLSQADAILTPSEHVKQEIIDHYGFPAEQIQVTPLGVTAGFQKRSEDEIKPTLASHQLSYKQYILSVATTEPRKNLPRLLAAYGQLPDSLRSSHPLVLVGSAGWLNNDLNSQIRSMVSQGQIIAPGYVSQQQLQHLYAGAKIMALPSLYEGFGLPIIEAMASGSAVLTSFNSAMQEVAGSHAMLCDPLDVDSIEVGLRAAIEDDAWRHQAEINGLSHSAQFTWRRCAEATVKAYQM